MRWWSSPSQSASVKAPSVPTTVTAARVAAYARTSLRPQRATCAAFGLPATEEVLRRVTLLQHAERAAEKGLALLEA